MAARKEIDGSASVPAFYGKELRWRREQLGLTLEETVAGSFYGVSYLSEIERARRRMPLDLARHVDQVLGTDGFFARCCEDVRNARRGGLAEYFAPVAEMEKRARSIEEWGPALIPGLLHTAPYTRAITHVTHPLDLPEEVDEKVRNRLRRGRLFEDPKRPEYWVVLHEPLLRSPLLPPGEMAEQLDHVATLARSRRIVPQILPWNAPLSPFMAHSVKLMEFDDEPPVMYTEGPYHGQLIDDPAIVKRYAKAYDRLRAAALSSEASLAMIETTVEDLRNGNQRD
ncbi:helix-turn-helix transcriptional regulator [Streptomyces yangpuensis]|uniref:Helix-turn-helix transcriptional regulator n=1 Tax=Streptomyces yangpuensis TaxID=1648182 RepID=A0ABY5PXE8_9ACTN|nr:MULTISPECIES: helix-turn-helix transcriptional regulator [Streptomyces]UUY48837.1 helix-turn-helix transcriptional regulator [Streptomyces yangpuensis]